MSQILIVTGSVRKGRVADKVLNEVKKQLNEVEGVVTTIADLKDLDLPFFDAEHIPMSPEFNPTDERVQKWTTLVGKADGVLLLMPEYNHSMSAVLKNAIDWIYAEWNDKPVAIIGYGWSGASRAHETAKIVLGNLKARQLPTTTHLRFMKEIDTEGSIIDTDNVKSQIQGTLDELLEEIKHETAQPVFS